MKEPVRTVYESLTCHRRADALRELGYKSVLVDRFSNYDVPGIRYCDFIRIICYEQYLKYDEIFFTFDEDAVCFNLRNEAYVSR